jgi:hypothetical protein
MVGMCSTHGYMRNAYKFFLENIMGRNNLGNLNIDVRILLKWMLRK